MHLKTEMIVIVGNESAWRNLSTESKVKMLPFSPHLQSILGMTKLGHTLPVTRSVALKTYSFKNDPKIWH